MYVCVCVYVYIVLFYTTACECCFHQIHATTCGMKAFSSDLCAQGMEVMFSQCNAVMYSFLLVD